MWEQGRSDGLADRQGPAGSWQMGPSEEEIGYNIDKLDKLSTACIGTNNLFEDWSENHRHVAI